MCYFLEHNEQERKKEKSKRKRDIKEQMKPHPQKSEIQETKRQGKKKGTDNKLRCGREKRKERGERDLES